MDAIPRGTLAAARPASVSGARASRDAQPEPTRRDSSRAVAGHGASLSDPVRSGWDLTLNVPIVPCRRRGAARPGRPTLRYSRGRREVNGHSHDSNREYRDTAKL